jgi:hypothetical protein
VLSLIKLLQYLYLYFTDVHTFLAAKARPINTFKPINGSKS